MMSEAVSKQPYGFNPMAAPYPNFDIRQAPYNQSLYQSDTDRTLKDLLARLIDKNNRESLPKPEPEVFEGDLLKYPMWITSFVSLIESKTNKPEERLRY